MSLDISLYRKYHVSYDNGKTLQERTECVYDANITHNLTKMADEASIYEAMWCPEEIGATCAGDIIKTLEKGLADLELRPEHFKMFDSPNGWGTYDDFVPFVRSYLNACKECPTAYFSISR